MGLLTGCRGVGGACSWGARTVGLRNQGCGGVVAPKGVNSMCAGPCVLGRGPGVGLHEVSVVMLPLVRELLQAAGRALGASISVPGAVRTAPGAAPGQVGAQGGR